MIEVVSSSTNYTYACVYDEAGNA